MTRTIAAAAVLLSIAILVSPASAADDTMAPAATGIIASYRVHESLSRPVVLPALYVSFAALQIFDMYSTNTALARGAREVNPLMQEVVTNKAAFWTMKAGVTAATIFAAERLWKKNKVAAIAVMAAGNSVAAIVAARNAHTLRELR